MAVPGLSYVAGFLAEPDQARLLSAVDAMPWLNQSQAETRSFR
jgi:hypothetical protein